MLAFLDRQHTGKPNKWNDTGCVNLPHLEVSLTSLYIHFAEVRLRELGIDVCVLSDGSYKDRHERVNKYASTDPNCCYISCHINAGGGNYATCFYDHRSTKGPVLARYINDRLNNRVPILQGNTVAVDCNPEDWSKNAFYTISGVSPVAICFEPFFIDFPDHYHLCEMDELKNIGTCLADGIATFLRMERS